MKRVLLWAAAAFVLLIAGTAIAFWTPDTDPAAMRAKYGGPPSRFVDVGGGLSVHLRDEGPRDAPVIMLLHGSNADLHTWGPWARELSTTYRVVRFDQIGHGLTGPNPSRDYSDAAFVDGVERVRRALALDRFVLAGNSMGGGVAWRYALQHPTRLRGLVLVDSSGAPSGDRKDLPLGFRLAQTPVVGQLMVHITPRSILEKTARQSVANQAIMTPAMIDRYWELLRYPGNREATRDRFRLPRHNAPAERLRAIRIPTLILWGEQDRVIPVASARWFKRHIPGSRLVIYSGIGHLPMEEAPERSAADLRQWLAGLS